MKIAVVKPDHFGDLLLSSAAIRAILAHHPDAAIFVAPTNISLARFLFGEACDLREIEFPHLSKLGQRQSVGPDLFAFDLVLFLRNDSVVDPRWADPRCRDFIFPIDTHDDHQAMLDYARRIASNWQL
jgi:hypothetical protein